MICHNIYCLLYIFLTITFNTTISGVGDTEIKCRPRPCFGLMCAIGCGHPPNIGNKMVATDTCSSYPIHTKIWYKCGEDYHYAIAPSWCGNDGKWSRPKLTCNPIDCGPPPQYNGFTPNVHCTMHRCTAEYRCNDGEVTGTKTITCKENEEWQPTANLKMKCPLNCRKQAYKGIHEDFPNITKHGERPDIKNGICRPGYRPSHEVTDLRCNDGRFVPAFNCDRVDCGKPREIFEMQLEEMNRTRYKDRAKFKCHNGTMEGSMFATCNETGQWDFGNASCNGMIQPILGTIDISVETRSPSQEGLTTKRIDVDYITKDSNHNRTRENKTMLIWSSCGSTTTCRIWPIITLLIITMLLEKIT